ncbi:MAG: FAD-binding protein [Anaerolineae bacterium]|nr:FAD-binding protein [Anaerolineae bacterium]
MYSFDHQVDVLIVGSGAGALVGALVVKEAGFEPLVIEKTDMIGGSSAMSGGGLWIPNNPVSLEAGLKDSFENAWRYLEAVVPDVGPVTSPERRRAFLEYGPKMVEFLRRLGFRWHAAVGYPDYYPEQPGGSKFGRAVEGAIFDGRQLGPWLKRLRIYPGAPPIPFYINEVSAFMVSLRTLQGFTTVLRIFGRLVPRLWGRVPMGMGASLVGQLLYLCLQRNVSIWLESPFLELITENGRVVGAVVEHDGRPLRVRARGGVLLAAGGFEHNQEMREQYLPKPTSKNWTVGAPGNTGDAIRAAQAIGAAVALMDKAWGGPVVITPQGQALFLVGERSLPFSIIVDSKGERFMNESASYVDCWRWQYERHQKVPAIPAWLIMESRHRRYYPFGTLPPGVTPRSASGPHFLVCADTLRDLALRIGVDPDGLERTVVRFNEMARRGRDEDFHRGESAYDRFYSDPRVKPNPNLGPLEQPPFYATAVYPGDLGTAGGLLTNEWGQVVREDGEPITGLYATGNASASLFGGTYPGPGSTIGLACTFAYIAMQHAVRALRERG